MIKNIKRKCILTNTMITKEQIDELINAILSRPQMFCQTCESFDDIMFLMLGIRFAKIVDINNQIVFLSEEKMKKYIKNKKELLTQIPLSKYFDIDEQNGLPSIVSVWKEIKEELYVKLES